MKEYGTPFALKETYAKDKLKLLPKEGKIEELGRKLRELQIDFREKEECLVAVVPESMAALPILDRVRDLIGGFEMIQGTMDDVFLNVTGKKLEA